MKAAIPEIPFARLRHGSWRSLAARALAAGMVLSGVSARAMIMTTWKLPENEKSLNAENTNAVALLTVRRMIDGIMVVYRTDAPDSLAASAEKGAVDPSDGGLEVGFIDEATLPGLSLVRSAGASRVVNNFSASDNAANYGRQETWEIGDNGGKGFGGWIQLGDSLPSRSFQNDHFAVSNDGGVGRPFEHGEKLDSGTFTASAIHEFSDAFSGFAVYGYGDDPKDGYKELLRWGITSVDDRTGLCTAINHTGRNDYVFFETGVFEEGQSQVAVDYTLTWSAYTGGLEFSVEAKVGGDTYGVGQLKVVGAKAVAAIGVLTASNSGGKAFLFDNLAVEGHIIPEPGTLSLLLLGSALLALRRKNG